MKNRHSEIMNKNTLALALTLVVLAAAYRVFGAVYVSALPNFSPVMAMAFCSGLMLPGVLAVAVAWVSAAPGSTRAAEVISTKRRSSPSVESSA